MPGQTRFERHQGICLLIFSIASGVLAIAICKLILGLMAKVCRPNFLPPYKKLAQVVRGALGRPRKFPIDAARHIPSDEEHFYDLVHLSEIGSAAQARLVASALQPALKY